MQSLAILLLTMSPPLAKGGVLDWVEGKSASNKSDPCAVAFPGMNLKPHLSIPNACWSCPKGGSVPTGTDSDPSCSIEGTNLNACHNQQLVGVLDQKKNICISCLPGKTYKANGCY